MKKHAPFLSKLYTLLIVLILVAGAGVLAYPQISNWWSAFRATRAIQSYTQSIQVMDHDECQRLLSLASDFNTRRRSGPPYELPEAMREEYFSLLNADGNGIMGYIDIPVSDISLPVYHGTDESVLQIAVGHLDWSSLPTGGESTHCVVSGHTGLPSAELFTKVDRLAIGDRFMFYVLNQTLTYEVDQILTVLPDEVSALAVSPGNDFCTLVTCTPYGINTHRLLIRGHRVENEESEVWVAAEAVKVDPLLLGCVMAIPFAVVWICTFFAPDPRRKSKKPK